MRAPRSLPFPMNPGPREAVDWALRPVRVMFDQQVRLHLVEKELGAANILPNAHVMGDVESALKGVYPDKTLKAVALWGTSRRSDMGSADVRVGFLLEDGQGKTTLDVAHTWSGKNWSIPSQWERLATWALDNKVSLVKNDGVWSWASPTPSANVSAVRKGFTQHAELLMLDGLVGNAATDLVEHIAQVNQPKAPEPVETVAPRRPRRF